LDDHAALPRKLLGARRGVLYQRTQDGRPVYSTRQLPGSVAVQTFAIPAAPRSRRARHVRRIGPPRLNIYSEQFRAAAKATGTEEAWLRAIAHIESDFSATAVSPKGAAGIMQLMPATARHHHVTDPFDPKQSIFGGARHLRALQDRYGGDRSRIAAAYNAGTGAVERYDGVPPYAETQAYVENVLAVHARYRAALNVSEDRLPPALTTPN
ncbi:MAG: lytic transglycosylase domain-containing protein, partial [Chromatiales bacterium]|nr:lytic transglycosylase domain-containing protein [Chromatiales bacterium]